MKIFEKDSFEVFANLEEVLSRIEEKFGSKKIRVLLQLPDGLKPYFDLFYKKIKERLKEAEIWIWFDSNFGACDFPFYFRDLGFDALIHVGHSDLFYKLKEKES